MAKLKMLKIEIITPLSDGKGCIERLQRRGAVELKNIEDDSIVKCNTSTAIAQFERSLSNAESALSVLNPFSTEKKSLLAFLNGRTPVSTDDFGKMQEKCNETISLCSTVNALQKSISDSKASIERDQTAKDMLVPWMNLDISASFTGTALTRFVVGTLTGQHSKEDLDNLITENLPDVSFDVTVISSRKEMTYFAVMTHKDDFSALNQALSLIGFVPYRTNVNKTPKEQFDELESSIKSSYDTIKKSEEKLRSLAKNKAQIEFLIDYFTLKVDKYKAINLLGMTEKTMIIEGYIPERYASSLIKEFESKYTVAVSLSEPGDDEDVPVLLKNGKFAEPVEGITEMYAMPSKFDIDPNAVMSFCYYFLFGIMLSDAGYGLLILIVTSILLKKFNIEGTLNRSLRMFRYCGISTLFWGAMFGSWFGDLPQVIATNFFGAKTFSTALWFEPLDDPVTLLLYCCGFGVLHLFLGLGVRFYMLWKDGKKSDAIFDVIPVYLAVAGFCPIAANMLKPMPAITMEIGKYAAIVGAVLIVLTSGRSSKNIFLRFFGGIYGLYGIATGYLSDILSYSRLLALGLATGCIGNAINMMGTMPQNPVLKGITLFFVAIFGHGVNIAINMLGAYVHTDRLQFVELFSKFYEGGGRAFNPLKSNTKYYKFEKENIYE